MENTVWEFQHAVTCQASCAQIWSFLTDVTNWERLEGTTVNWIRIYGPFDTGTNGETKMPGKMPQRWVIGPVEEERLMVIEVPLEGAVFYNRTELESLEEGKTRILRTMSLAGPNAAGMTDGMQAFEQNAPLGLAKMAREIEAKVAEERKNS
ncbi:SRPBCC family protein [Flavilitoribacter nigricans]|uniref:SRPBCC domain-containing protein n=1 Tax=Flavilitoribacter nigricans (strain ATCC 23147 / DSM 23189 / NBRC 102662 / NCIMB 1420 / SS-2) TaxID=1122177 RepID=A0A2D0N8L7_FLAN2|nr:SRPBCC family protein [Flavilitoribacter nigricans]PHN04113.1 hypothetical protein CRP01_23230 [Flavilitoribacter nigricans DSM 23189 = NBRC 102662]